MDAMDQDKTAIPRLCETPKSLGNIWRLKVNLMGAIVHGMGVYGFVDAFQWAHGASYTLSVLVHILSLLDFLPDIRLMSFIFSSTTVLDKIRTGLALNLRSFQ
jgi:hypothetical protein